MMSGIRGKDTRPELQVRRGLHRLGLRFRLHRKDLPGTPDIVLPKWNAVIEVRGCFWHRHEGCRYATTPDQNFNKWAAKFAANTERDVRTEAALRRLGWRVAIVWECATRSLSADAIALKVRDWLRSSDRSLSIPD